MAWSDTKSESDLISSQMWNGSATTLVWVSGNYFNHSSNSDAHFPSSNLTGWLDSVYISSTASVNKLNDVDTVSDAPARDEVLKWNGSNWVPAAYGASFEFTIASFSDGESTTKLIGVGEWKAATAISFTATYNNGPPDNSDVYVGYNSTSYYKSGVIGVMDGADAESGDNDVSVSYPSNKDQYLQFNLSSNVDSDTDTQTESAIYFRNYIYWGIDNKNNSFSEADVEALSNSDISNDQTRSMSINCTAGNYLVFAYPDSYTRIPSGSDYETNGGTGFLFNGIACAFSGAEIVSITNSAGYVEDYKVYASNLPNLGNHSLVTTTSVATVNTLYYGVTTTTSGYDEADIEGLANTTNTNDNTQVWSAVDASAGEYLLFSFPVRLGTVTFWAGGFEGGFEDSETVSVTNANGYTEDYYVWRSTQAGLGSTVITTT